MSSKQELVEPELFTLKNDKGTTVVISNYGGIIKEFNVNGTNIILTKDDIKDYKNGNAYMSALIGRVGNRIGKGTFSLNGKTYHIPINNGPNSNHGGEVGFDSKIWTVKSVEPDKLVLNLISEDGDQGFPGEVNTTATFTLNNDNQLIIDFEATSTEDTPINLTSHSYFNLNGKGDIKHHKLKVNSETITASDKDLLPTGEIISIKDTPLDFSEFKPVIDALIEDDDINIQNAKGVDHNFIFKNKKTDEIIEMAELIGDDLYLKVYSDQPGLQVYSGNYLDEEGPNGEYYENYAGIAFEPQNWPDAINHENFPDSVLTPEDVYKARIIYEAGKINE